MKTRMRTPFLTACSRSCSLPTINDTSFIGPIEHQMDRAHTGGGDAFKLNATVVKDGFELGIVEVKPPREERHQPVAVMDRR